MKMKKFLISTFGCKVNQYESQNIKEMMEKYKYKSTEKIDDAQIVIINSCTVTASGDSKVKKFLRKIKRDNKDCIIVLIGCMPQAFPEKAQDIIEADIIIGNSNYLILPQLIEKHFNTKEKIICVQPHKENESFQKMIINKFSEHTRAFVKIEDGCNNFCSYCIIPYSRGRVRSKSTDDIKTELENLSTNGYKEVVLTGINLSCYGNDFKKNLLDAVEIACTVKGIKRIRLGSLEPEFLSENIIKELSGIEKLCTQFHLSLQSGCNETLKRMNRHYDTDEYSEIVKNIRSNFINPAITTDVMVGFAGETDDEFYESLDFVEKTKFAKVHVFPYSQRPGTMAYNFNNQINQDIKVKRVKKMTAIVQKSRAKFLKSQIGNSANVLIEREYINTPDFFLEAINNNSKKIFEGYSENYTPIKILSDKNISGKIINVQIFSYTNDFCTSAF